MIAPLLLAFALGGGRAVQPLDGTWEITTDDPRAEDAQWKPIEVPSAFETALGTDFDGVATYRLPFRVGEELAGEHLLLCFDAVATEAEVELDGARLGNHLGGWTPFRFDATEPLRRGGEHELLVRVDEKVGHDTQGFLPIIAPHFGGIWQSVSLLSVGPAWIDDSSLLAYGDAAGSRIVIEPEVRGEREGVSCEVVATIGGREFRARGDASRLELPVEGFERWSPANPRLYPLVLRLVDPGGRELDRVETRVAFREVRADGRSLFLNDAPLQVRGMLEWGYYPPLLAPAPSEERVLREIREARARGFNLVKFCLWVPPRRVLELLDEQGMLAWIEYPTWHPRFDDEHAAELGREFEEFFRHDRNHPCVVLRSLTCETGPSASIELVQDLYERAHRAIPGALIEDDSSWIEWNRVTDFYDDHPYGNNDAWPATLDRLNAYIDEREPKPLVLGEAIAADTWLDLSIPGDSGAWWARRCEAEQRSWEGAMRARFGDEPVDRMRSDSLRFALNERKDQIETYRMLVPGGGYVVSVARDFSLATMGLADLHDEWKWSAEAWAFQGDTALALGRGTPRSFGPGEHELPVWIAHHGAESIEGARLVVAAPARAVAAEPRTVHPGEVVEIGRIALDVPDDLRAPRRVELRVEVIGAAGSAARNRWDAWEVPAPQPIPPDVRVERRLDPELFADLREGARVLLLASDEPGSFLVQPHWFLRGAPWFPESASMGELPPEMLLDLLVKDLHPAGLMPTEAIFDQIDPLVAFWDTHDRSDVRDWTIAFETRVGAGRLSVTCMRHEGSAAGAWLEGVLARRLAEDEGPEREWSQATVEAIANGLGARVTSLTDREWDFRPEPEGEPPGEWTKLRVGSAWEGQGFPTLDGWARYRLRVEVPEDWFGEPLFAWFDGVDDAYEVLFDGEVVGRGGDVEKRETAFDERSSHRLMERAVPGEHVLEVRVLDWYGAGGIHRPVWLATRGRSGAVEFLRR